MNFILYLFFRLMVAVNRFVPFFVFYACADIFYFFMFYLFQYRKKVVIANLKRVFPQKNQQEIIDLTKKFYHNLSDIMLESIKGFSASQQELVNRYKILNPEILDSYFEQNQNVILLGAHYTNWEWGALATGAQLKHQLIALYKPLSNKFIDKYLKERRAAWNMQLVSIRYTTLVFNKKREKPAGIIMLADQCPTKLDRAYFVEFLGQDTACLHGPEKHSRRKNLPLLYVNMQRVKRGYYELTIEPLVEVPGNYEEGKITEMYMKRLEQIILEKPENWLWSHRRWKRIREEKFESKEA